MGDIEQASSSESVATLLYLRTCLMSALLLQFLPETKVVIYHDIDTSYPWCWVGLIQKCKLYFPLNFRTQTASEFGFKPPTKRFVKLARLSQVPSKFEKWRANPRFYVLRADIHCR